MSKLHQGQGDQRLSIKIMEMLRQEMEKSGTKEKIKCMIDPVFLYIIGVLQPYIVIVVAIMMILLFSQGYMISRLWHVQKVLNDLHL